MNWLVVFKKDLGRERATSLLRELGAEIAAQGTFVPLGDDEEVIEVSGPQDLPERARGHEGIRIYPSSKMSPF